MSIRIDSIEVKFDYPATIKSTEVDTVRIRNPKVKDMKNMSKIQGGSSEQEIWLMSSLTGVSISDIENLDMSQYELLQESMGKFKRSPTKTAE